MLEVDQWPVLRSPVVLVALSGWIDAGLAGAGTLAYVAEHADTMRGFATIDCSELVDLQQTRPTVELVDGETRRITWPSVDLLAGHAGVDIVLCTGPEPSIHWREFTASLVEAFGRLQPRMVVCLGGMPSAASHRRPMNVFTTAGTSALAQDLGELRGDYRGVTGVQTVLQVGLRDAGIPAATLWAQVPHYLAATTSPVAVRAILERLRSATGVEVPLQPLDEPAQQYLAQVDEGLRDRPDVAALIDTIEGGLADLPSGDELALEIERYLRDEG